MKKDPLKKECYCRSEAYNFIKKDTLVQMFTCEFCEISKNTFFTEHLWTTASDFGTPLRIRVRATVSIKPCFFMMSHQ